MLLILALLPLAFAGNDSVTYVALTEGQSATFDCDSSTGTFVGWRVPGALITADTRDYLLLANHGLAIPSVSEGNKGLYACIQGETSQTYVETGKHQVAYVKKAWKAEELLGGAFGTSIAFLVVCLAVYAFNETKEASS